MKLVFLAFNIGESKGHPVPFVNGPGMSLLNFVKFIKQYNSKIKICVYTQLKTFKPIKGIVTGTLKQKGAAQSDIADADVVHCWSGLTKEVFEHLEYAKRINKKIFFGPNLLDTVQPDDEANFLKEIRPDKIFFVNDRLTYLAQNKYKLDPATTDTLIVGPDTEQWAPLPHKSNIILWKGNSNHMVKDVEFALEVSKKLEKYKFLFLGYPEKYSYQKHIDKAKRVALYFSTSLSETKGMTLLEQWAAGVPSVTHPKIYQHGINYKTGIVTNRDVDSYCEAIDEIMSDDLMRSDMSKYCVNYVREQYNPEKLIEKYIGSIKNVG